VTAGDPFATRWATDTGAGHSREYVARMRRMAAEGADLEGEARLIDVLVPRRARVLDAGCGTGRTGAALHDRGHTVVGVDVDPVLVEAARADHPGSTWLVADLADLDLPAAGVTEPFDAAVLAGNVMVFLAPGTEGRVLRRVAAHVVADGAVVTGFATDRDLSVAAFDRAAGEAGLRVEHRFATWDLRPWHPDAGWAVSVLRHA
jgi:SAM-dependent methyltransferase